MNDDSDSVPLEIAPGVWRICTRMPGHPLGFLNSYLLTSTDGHVLIDTPWAIPSVIAELEAGIRRTGHSPADVRTVLITHYHEDHSGAAGWFQERYGSDVGIHAADAACYRARRDVDEFAVELETWFDEIGAEAIVREGARRQYRHLIPYASTSLHVDLAWSGGEELTLAGRRILVIHTPGHTPGSVCYFDVGNGFLFSGDHVFEHRHSNALKRPPNVRRPIAAYWESSRHLLALRPGLVLPGHDGPIPDLDARMRRLAEVRDEKLAEAVALARGGSAWDLAVSVRRSRTWADLTGDARLAATGELLGYLYEALDAGTVAATGKRPIRWTKR